MKKNYFLLFILFYNLITFGFQKKEYNKPKSIKILTWNIQDLGGTKNDEEIVFIGNILKDYDIVALQEIVAKDPAGAKAVAKIIDVLNRLGSKWNYSISNATNSTSSYVSERYAFLWKTAKIKPKKSAYLDKELEQKIEREPYIAMFEFKPNKSSFYIINMHARTYNKHPEIEISNFKKYPKRLQSNALIILGDFNLTEKHTVWNPLYKIGFKSAVKNQPTTLKKRCLNGNYLNYPIDNIYYNQSYFKQEKSYIIDFVKNCENLSFSRKISDHLPVVSELLIIN